MALGGKGQLPGGQTAKARPGYRVQSLQNGHATTRSIKSKHDANHARRECLSRCGQPKMARLSAGDESLSGGSPGLLVEAPDFQSGERAFRPAERLIFSLGGRGFSHGAPRSHHWASAPEVRAANRCRWCSAGLCRGLWGVPSASRSPLPATPRVISAFPPSVRQSLRRMEMQGLTERTKGGPLTQAAAVNVPPFKTESAGQLPTACRPMPTTKIEELPERPNLVGIATRALVMWGQHPTIQWRTESFCSTSPKERAGFLQEPDSI